MGVGQYRMIGPLKELTDSGRICSFLLPALTSDKRFLPYVSELIRAKPTVFFLQNAFSDFHLVDLQHYAELLPDLFRVFGQDDIVFSIPQKSSARKHFGKDTKARVRKAVSLCHRAIVTTEPIAEAMRGMVDDIRVMPNTPAFVLAGMSGMSANRVATDEDKRVTRTVLEAVGKVIEFEEKDLDAVTALSGSGPAYAFYLIESMTAGGIGVGLDPEDAATLAVNTVRGAVKLLIERGESPESLRKKVTSPGGTTEAALEILESNRVKQIIIDAIAAATRRSIALSR